MYKTLMNSLSTRDDKIYTQYPLLKGNLLQNKLLSNKQHNNLSIYVLAILSIICLLMTGCVDNEASSQSTDEKAHGSDRIFPVCIWPVKTQDIIYTIDATCSMVAECDTDVSAEVDGRVQKIFYEEGDIVSEGASLVWLDDERYRSIVQEHLAKLRLAKANLVNTEKLIERKKKLFHDGVISSQEYDDTNNQLQVALASVDQAKASLSLAQKNLKDTKIKAPISGIISSKLVDIGEYVKKETPLLNIVKFDPIKVKLYLPEKFASQIVPGKKISVAVDAFPNEIFQGEIYFVNPKIVIETRRLECLARIPNKEFKLKPGFFGSAKLVVAIHKSSPVIPEECVLSENGKTYCYIVDGERARKVTVTTGLRIERGLVEILKGINSDDSLIFRGQHVLNDGNRIKVVKESL